MNITIKTVAAGILALLAASCGSTDTSNDYLSRISDAETAFDSGATDSARSLCTEIIADSAQVDQTPTAARTYLLTALLMTRLADKSHDTYEEDMAIAARCFDKAVSASADSVIEIANTFDIDRRSRLLVLRQITGLLQSPGDDPDTPIDSVSADAYYFNDSAAIGVVNK